MTNTTRPDDLKKIINDTIGKTASSLLLNRIFTLLDEEKNDLGLAADKIEKMVGLFISRDAASTLKQKFNEKLS